MKIKRQLIYGFLGIISISLGLFLLIELIKTIGHYGYAGYAILIIFLFSLVLYLRYEFEVKSNEKLADKVTDQVISEYKNRFDPSEISKLKKQLNQNLKSKIYEESYTLFGKK